jgi:hypothetical protein
MTADTLDGATTLPEEGSFPGDPGEFAAAWNASNPERRARWLDAMNRSVSEAAHCFMADHAGQIRRGWCNVTHTTPDGTARCAMPRWADHGSVHSGPIDGTNLRFVWREGPDLEPVPT